MPATTVNIRFVSNGNQAEKRTLADPRRLAEESARLGMSSEHWLGKANSWSSSRGRSPGVGYVLMLQAQLDDFDNGGSSHQIEFFDSSLGTITIRDLTITKAEAILAGQIPNIRTAYLVRVEDVRMYGKDSQIDSTYNVRALDGDFFDDSLNSSSEWTWATLLTDMWGNLPSVFGTAPTAPSSFPTANPQNLRFQGVNCWDTINDIVEKVGHSVILQGDGTFAIVDLSVSNPTVVAALNDAQLSKASDMEFLRIPDETKFPASYKVFFPAQNFAFQDSTDADENTGEDYQKNNPYNAVTVNTSSIDSSLSTIAGTVKIIHDTRDAIYDELGVVSNGSELTTLATELATQHIGAIKNQNTSIDGVFYGLHDFIESSDIAEVAIYDVGNGLFTQVKSSVTKKATAQDSSSSRELDGQPLINPLAEINQPVDFQRIHEKGTRLAIAELQGDLSAFGSASARIQFATISGGTITWADTPLPHSETIFEGLGKTASTNDKVFCFWHSQAQEWVALTSNSSYTWKISDGSTIATIASGETVLIQGNSADFGESSWGITDTAPGATTTESMDLMLCSGIIAVDFTDSDSTLPGTGGNSITSVTTLLGKAVTATLATGTVLNSIGASGSAGDFIILAYDHNAGNWEIIEAPPTTGGDDITENIIAKGGVGGVGIQDASQWSIAALGQMTGIVTETIGDGISLNADTITTGDAIFITADGLTAGSGLHVISNSADTSPRSIIDIINQNALSTGATALSVQQASTMRAVHVEQLGNGQAIVVTSSATTGGSAIQVLSPAQTSSDVIDLTTCDSLTEGGIISAKSNSASVSGRRLVEIINTNTAATATRCLHLQQEAANEALFIDATGIAIEIDQNSNSASDVYAIDIVSDNAGAGLPGGIDLSAFAVDEPVFAMPPDGDALADFGTAGHFSIRINGVIAQVPAFSSSVPFAVPVATSPVGSESGAIAYDSTTTEFSAGVLKFHGGAQNMGLVAMPAANFETAYLSGKDGYHVAFNATGDEFELVEGGGTTAITDNIIPKGTGTDIEDSGWSCSDLDALSATVAATANHGIGYTVNSLETGNGLSVTSSSAHVGTRSIIRAVSSAAAATGTTVLTVEQAAANRAMFVSQTADGLAIEVSAASATENAVEITADSLGVGSALLVTSSSTSASTRTVGEFRNNGSGATGATCLTVTQESNARGFHVNQTGNGIAAQIEQSAIGDSAIDIIQRSNNASDVYAITIDNTNTPGAGLPGGIDMSTGFVAEDPLLKAVADGGTTADFGTLGQFAVDINGTVGFVPVFSATRRFNVPSSDSGSVSTEGDMVIDSLVTDWSTGVIRVYASNEEQGLVAMPIAEFTSPTDAHVVSYNATNDEFELVAQTGGSGLDTITTSAIDEANQRGVQTGDATVNLAGTTAELEADYGVEITGSDAGDKVTFGFHTNFATIAHASLHSSDSTSLACNLTPSSTVGTKLTAITVKIHSGSGGTNIRNGDIFPVQRGSDGTWHTTHGQDDKILTMKQWLGTVADIPAGWARMDGTANSTGSGIAMYDASDSTTASNVSRFARAKAGTGVATDTQTGDNLHTHIDHIDHSHTQGFTERGNNTLGDQPQVDTCTGTVLEPGVRSVAGCATPAPTGVLEHTPTEAWPRSIDVHFIERIN